jgi:predicted metalloendopeptidase
MKNLSILLLILILFTSCQQNHSNKKQQPIGLNLEFMDKSIRPQDDFYNFVNGEWMKNTKIPADRSRWGSFDELRKNTDKNTLKILKEAQKNTAYKAGSDQRKALDYFASIMDIQQRTKEGIKPIKTFLDKINAIQNKQDVAQYMIETEPVLSSVFMGIGVGADMKNSTKNVLYLSPSGLGLPERDYYVSDTDDAKKIRAQYQEHIGKMLKFIGKTDAEISQAKNNILALETKLAQAKLTKEERRKPENTYNPMTVEQLANLMPDFDLKNYLKAFHLNVEKVIVTQPNYLKTFNTLYKNEKIDIIKDFLTWHLLRSTADKLSPEISDANWEFYGKTLDGLKERRPLEERALATVNWSIGEAVGKLYVDKMFPPEAKTKAKEMINYLQKAYRQRINNLTWMSDETKKKAIEKVNALQIKIGYPDKWKDYSKLQILAIKDGGSYFDNSLRVSKWHFEENIAKLNKPVDKTEWGMAPQIVNAYYNPSYNEIVFPAAILQAPFYDYKADEAVNYGGMGAVIGHEISHGFDDQGAKFNAEGNFEQWWTNQDFEQFNVLVKKLADQYSKLEPLPNIFVNGEFTSGENIGDLGGVNAAYTALQLYYKDHKKPDKIQGFTPEQRFYLSWATIWRTKSRDEALKKQIKTDPHSPGQIRATQPLKNVDAFYKAFDIKEGDRMYMKPEDRVKIW